MRRHLAEALAGRRPGQSIAEYSLILWFVTFVILGASFDLLPAFINAFQRYFDSFYALLNLPIP